MSKNESGGWRYQTVYIEHGTGDGEITREYSLCEVYLDKNGKLDKWTESRSMSPMGESVEELIDDLQFMLNDAAKWKSVEFESMKVGMTFTKNTQFENPLRSGVDGDVPEDDKLKVKDY